MKRIAVAMVLLASYCHAQAAGGFQPATTNVWGAECPRVDASGRAKFRIKAPNATAVKLKFWSNPKLDMVKGSDGFWTAATPPLAPGFEGDDPKYYLAIAKPKHDAVHSGPEPTCHFAGLDGIASWMQTNGEAIHETRPWKVCGEGLNGIKADSFQGGSINKLGVKDIRFTRNKANAVSTRWC